MDQLLYGRIFGLPVWVVGLVVIGGAIAVYFLLFRNRSSSSSGTLGQNSAGQQAAVPPVDQSLYDPYTGAPLAAENAINPATGQPNYYNNNPGTGGTPSGSVGTVRSATTAGTVAGYDASNPGVPIDSSPGGSQTGFAPFGTQIVVTGPAVQGPSNFSQNPNAGPGSNLWYPVAGGGYVSAYDLTGAPHGGARGPYQATDYWPIMMDMPVRR